MDKFKQDNLLEPSPDVLLFELLEEIEKLKQAWQNERAMRVSLAHEVEVLRRVIARIQEQMTELGWYAPQPVRRAAWWQFWR